jgi:iron complex transport system substrate-binding protein
MRITLIEKVFFKALLIFAAMLIVACTGKNGNEIPKDSKTESRELLDRSGRTVTINGPINRVVSTAPSNTEIIVDLGLADKLVAIDRYSTDVWDQVPAGLMLIDFSYPDAEAILGLEPDLILASGHNVTVSGDDPFRLLKEMGIPVAYISMSTSIEGIYGDIAFVADLLSEKSRGDQLISSMKAQVDELTRRTAQAAAKRTVFFKVSAATEIYTFGRDSYINDMISTVNGRNIFGDDNWILTPSVEAIIERNPDVIITSVNYMPDPIGEIKSRDGFSHISAVMDNRIYQVDANSVSRPSSRIMLALNQMARAVYPELYE